MELYNNLNFVSKSAYVTAAFPNQEIIDYIEGNLPQSGYLRKTEDGFVYLDVDDDYIYKLNHLITAKGFELPPYFNWTMAVGAHITVMTKEESLKYGIDEIEEIGLQVPFKVKECQVVHPPSFTGVEEVCFITVEAPELDAIREKYGLPPALYDFHITIGVKRYDAFAI